MKKLLLILSLFLALSSNAQVNWDSWTIATPTQYDMLAAKSQFRFPLDSIENADSGSAYYKGRALHIKTDSGWVTFAIGGNSGIEVDPTIPTWVKSILASDITYWNNKQSQLNGIGYVKANGNVITYENIDFLTQAEADLLYAGKGSGGSGSSGGHFHIPDDITGLTTYVRNLFFQGTGVVYNDETGVIAIDSATVVSWLGGSVNLSPYATLQHLHDDLDSLAATISGGEKVDSVTFASGINVDTVLYWINGASYISGYIDRQSDGVVSGGVVTWTGTGLAFDVSSAVYYIGGVRYTSPATQITLNAADGSNPRLDVIALDATGAIKITGTPAGSPSAPTTGPSQIYLTTILVNTGATTPSGVTNTTIYNENTEWTGSTSGTITADFNNTTSPQSGTKVTAVTSWSNGSIFYTNSSAITGNASYILKFYLKLSAAIPITNTISVRFFNGSSAVSNSVNISYNRNTTGSYQAISMAFTQFNFTSYTFDRVRISFGNSGSSTIYIDNVFLQSGIDNTGGSSGITNAYGFITDGTNTAASSGEGTFKIRSADNKLSVAVANDDATHGDNLLLTLNQSNLSLSSIGGSLNVSQINATGTASASTYLRGDGSWQAISGGGDVYLANNQTFTGINIFDKELVWKQVATPSNPASGYHKVYFKNDGLPYMLDALGAEKAIGGIYSTGTLTQNIDIGSSSDNYGVTFYRSGTGNVPTVNAISTSGTAIQATSTSGVAINATTTSGSAAGIFTANPSSTNTLVEVLRVARGSTGTAASGIGGFISFVNKVSDGSSQQSGRFVSKWTDVTLGTRTSQNEIWASNSGTNQAVFYFMGNGDAELPITASGIIMKSPDGTRYKVTVANGGTLTVTAL